MQSSKSISSLSITSYFSFLLKNHLSEATREVIAISREHDLSILKFFEHMPEDEFFELSKNSFKTFLTSIIENRILEETNISMERWRADQLDTVPQQHVALKDLNFINSTRRRVFLSFLPKFVSDPESIIQIALEIERMYSEIEEIHIKTYLEIHDLHLNSLNTSLQEYQEELQVTNEELQESYEEVQATNEELREQIEIRRTIEEELAREKNFLSLILGNIHDGIVACNDDGILSYFNSATKNLHGIKEEALPPEEWSKHYQLYHSDGVTLMEKEDVPLFRAYNGKEVKDIEMVIRSSDGSRKTILANGERILSSDNLLLGALVVMHDITERKALAEKQAKLLAQEAAASEARRQKEIFENFFDNAPVPISIVKGPDHEFTLINKSYQESFFPEKVLLHKKVLEAIPELKGSHAMEILNEVYKTGQRYIGKEIPVDLDRGKGFLETGYFNFIYEPFFSQDGTIEGIISLAYEITEILNSKLKFKELSDELAASNEELMAANEEIQTSLEDLSFANRQLVAINADLDNFIYTASHDLKAPIANIEGLIKVLVKQLSPESKEGVGQILDYINASIERFRNTLQNLTQVVKIQKEEQQEESINLNEIVEEVKLDLQLIISESGAKIDSSGCEAYCFNFSHKNFKSIIYNLISNAIKYASPDRHPLIKISCYNEGGFSVITVQDNGLGMDLSKDSKIFTMFKRLHSHVEGTGIGLYIVKKIIENNGGRIEVKSTVNEGTTFTVYLKN